MFHEVFVSQKAKSVMALRKGRPLVALSRIPVIKTAEEKVLM